ncbi:MAG: TetR/AcrR family transcriptional regulator [Acidimicrobiia bacterium]
MPAADRRAERRTLLIDAAFELLGTEGSAGTTVRAVCQRTRLNPRYFYESFEDLDALVVAVYDRVVDELGVTVAVAQESAGKSAASRMRATIACTVEFVDEDRRRGRVLYVEALGNEALNRRRIEAGYRVIDAVAGTGAGDISRVSAAILVGGLSELLVAWLDGRIDVTREQLVDDATALFLALGRATAGIASQRRA